MRVSLEASTAFPKTPGLAKAVSRVVTADPLIEPKKKRGRPISATPKSPRAEYQREYMRKHRGTPTA